MIAPAENTDIPALVKLINSAYRGEGSRRGWTTEAGLIEGELRTDDDSIRELMSQPHGIILKFIYNGALRGCVYLEKQEEKLYLGMLSVSPLLQTRGIGKKLLKAAEEYALEQGCRSIIMQVISLRHELISWYERHGYVKNGETKEFPDDNKFGTPTQPLKFVVLEKKI